MADDIVTQLEWLRDEFYDVDGVTAIVEVAAAEIERLRRQLRAAVLIITHYNDDPDAMEGVYAKIIKETE